MLRIRSIHLTLGFEINSIRPTFWTAVSIWFIYLFIILLFKKTILLFHLSCSVTYLNRNFFSFFRRVYNRIFKTTFIFEIYKHM